MPTPDQILPSDRPHGVTSKRLLHNSPVKFQQENDADFATHEPSGPDDFYRLFAGSAPGGTVGGQWSPAVGRPQDTSNLNGRPHPAAQLHSPAGFSTSSGSSARGFTPVREQKGNIGARIDAINQMTTKPELQSGRTQPDHLSNTGVMRRTINKRSVSGTQYSYRDPPPTTRSISSVAGQRDQPRSPETEPKHLRLLFGEVIRNDERDAGLGFGIDVGDADNTRLGLGLSSTIGSQPSGPPSSPLSPLHVGANVGKVADPGAEPPQRSPRSGLRVSKPSGEVEVLLTSRRYDPRQPMEPPQMLNAVVLPSSPKLSPLLRSSRPRQPVVAAASGGSRAKLADRYFQTSMEPNVQSKDKKHRTRVPQIPGGVDVAARRARLQDQLLVDQGQPHTHFKQRPYKRNMTISSSASASVAGETSLLAPVGPDLISNPKHNASSNVDPLTSHSMGTTSEERRSLGRGSPVSNIGRSTPSQNSAADQAPEVGETSAAAVRQLAPLELSFLDHVLRLRPENGSDHARTAAVDDFFSDTDEGETIQVILGATPVLPDWSEVGITQGSHAHVSNLVQTDVETDSNNSPSLVPDDSVSVVYESQRARTGDLIRLPTSAHSRYIEMLNLEGLASELEPQDAPNLSRQVNREDSHRRSINQTPIKAISAPDLSGLDEYGASPKRQAAVVTEDRLKVSPERFERSPNQGKLNATPSGASHPVLSETGFILQPEHGEGWDSPFRHDTNSLNFSKSLRHACNPSNGTLASMRSDSTLRVAHASLDDVPPALPPKDFCVNLSKHTPRSSMGNAHQPVGVSFSAESSASPLAKLGTKVRNSTYQPSGPFHRDSAGTSSLSEADEDRSIGARDVASDLKVVDLQIPGVPQDEHLKSSFVPWDNVVGHVSDGSLIPCQREDSFVAAQTARDTTTGPPTQPEMEKLMNERRNYIKELVDTEYSYSQDLTIMEDIYAGTASTVLGLDDRRILFGNLSALRSFSVEFLDALRQGASAVYTIPRENRWHLKRGSYGTSSSATTDQSSSTLNATIDKERIALDLKVTIGETFLEYLDQIEKLYGDWIVKTNDAANTRLKELQQKPTINMWLEECHASAKDITQAWSLDALIIKPAQRLMKYPLLLSAILKYTDKAHPDFVALRQANEGIMLIASRINEAKKRAELVDQAMNRKRKDSDAKLRVAKLLNRRTEKLKQHVGLTAVADDQDYEAIAQKFGGHFFQLQVVMRDVEKYLEDCQASVSWLNLFVRALVAYTQLDRQERWPEIESSWIRFGQAMQEIQDIALVEHLKLVRQHVIEPIVDLWKLHVGPQKMMYKRKKRLVDHIRYKTLVQRGEKADKKLQTEEDEYNAVNEVLKEELPKLYALTKRLVEACLANFIDLQADWQSLLQRKLTPFTEHKIERTGLDSFAASLQSTFNQDFVEWDSRTNNLSICNGSTLAEVQAIMSTLTSSILDEPRPSNRPRLSTFGSSQRTLSFGGDRTPGAASSGAHESQEVALPTAIPSSSSNHLRPTSTFQDEQYHRHQALSVQSSRGPSTPRTPSAQFSQTDPYSMGTPADVDQYLQQFEFDPRNFEPSRRSLGSEARSAPASGGTRRFGRASSVQNDRHMTEERFSGIFSSALPMSDSPPADSPAPSVDEAKVLFLAASLFEFNIDGSRREGGYPYLRYVPGEIFDVIAQKGELWLAKNQDDASKLVGWIWEKHFARILPDDP